MEEIGKAFPVRVNLEKQDTSKKPGEACINRKRAKGTKSKNERTWKIMTKREMGQMFKQYAKLDADIKRLQEERDRLNTTIKAAMAAEGLDICTAAKHTAILTHRAGAVRVDTKALKRDLPEVAAKYSYQGAPSISLTVRAVEAAQ